MPKCSYVVCLQSGILMSKHTINHPQTNPQTLGACLVHQWLLTVNLTGQNCEIRQKMADTTPPLFTTAFFCWEQKFCLYKRSFCLERLIEKKQNKHCFISVK